MLQGQNVTYAATAPRMDEHDFAFAYASLDGQRAAAAAIRAATLLKSFAGFFRLSFAELQARYRPPAPAPTAAQAISAT